MRLEIARLSITLHGVPLAFGEQVAAQLPAALGQGLASLGLGGAARLEQVDLGAIAAPQRADPQQVARLVALELAGWLVREHGGAQRLGAAPEEGC